MVIDSFENVIPAVLENISVTVEEADDKSAFVKWSKSQSRNTCSNVDTYIIFYEALGLQHSKLALSLLMFLHHF